MVLLEELPGEILVIVARCLIAHRDHTGLLSLMLASRACHQKVAFEAKHFRNTLVKLQDLIEYEEKYYNRVLRNRDSPYNRLTRVRSIDLAERMQPFQIKPLQEALNKFPRLEAVRLRLLAPAMLGVTSLAPQAALTLSIEFDFDKPCPTYDQPLLAAYHLKNIYSLTVLEFGAGIGRSPQYMNALAAFVNTPPDSLRQLHIRPRTDYRTKAMAAGGFLESYTLACFDMPEDSYRCIEYASNAEVMVPPPIPYAGNLKSLRLRTGSCLGLASTAFGQLSCLDLEINRRTSATKVAKILQASRLRQLTLRHLKFCSKYEKILDNLPSLHKLRLITEDDHEIFSQLIWDLSDLQKICASCPELQSLSIALPRECPLDLLTGLQLRELNLHLLTTRHTTSACYTCRLAMTRPTCQEYWHRAIHLTTCDINFANQVFQQVFSDGVYSDLCLESSFWGSCPQVLVDLVGRPIRLSGTTKNICTKRLAARGLKRGRIEALRLDAFARGFIESIWPALLRKNANWHQLPMEGWADLLTSVETEAQAAAEAQQQALQDLLKYFTIPREDLIPVSILLVIGIAIIGCWSCWPPANSSIRDVLLASAQEGYFVA